MSDIGRKELLAKLLLCDQTPKEKERACILSTFLKDPNEGWSYKVAFIPHFSEWQTYNK